MRSLIHLPKFRKFVRESTPEQQQKLALFFITYRDSGGKWIDAILLLLNWFVEHGPELFALIESFLKLVNDGKETKIDQVTAETILAQAGF